MALAGVFAFSARVGVAEETPQLAAGSRVRVEASTEEGRLVGSLLALDDRNLNLQVEDEMGPRIFPREDVTALAVSGGRHSRGRKALIVGGVCAAVGAIIGVATASEPDPDNMFDVSWSKAQGVRGGALFLGSIGALIGLALPPGERWEDVPLDTVRLSVRPVPGRGAGVFLSVGF
jgi:hypothetical protein